ncbi:YlbF family regulator [Halococcus agarilyticus]|uniref:YlbF family regulator n=1 Tax=Halococcus agarilyticus TaxID=1232219 RepID=UPI000678033A|nr:YlbF family regulator [Halococcus agarilyticus]
MSTEPELDAETDADAEPMATAGRPEDLAGDLGSAIADTPEYERFAEAKAEVERSPEAQEKVQEFERLRDEFMLARQTGEATEEDLRNLQNAQQDLHEIPAMAEFLEAQNRLDARLERIGDAVSVELDFDFGDRIGACCQD